MKQFWHELQCTALGHPGMFVLDGLEHAKISTLVPGRLMLNGGELPWRCARCRMTLADMVKEDRMQMRDQTWLERLGW